MSSEISIIPKDDLHLIIRNCRHATDSTEEFFETLEFSLQQIWRGLTENIHLETDHWNLYCRVAIIGLFFYKDHRSLLKSSMSNKELYDSLMLSLNQNIVGVDYFHPNGLEVKNKAAYKVAILYGLISLISFNPLMYSKEEVKEMYEHILDGCRSITRFTASYFVLLSNYIACYKSELNESDCTLFFNLLYHNIERKDCSVILHNVFSVNSTYSKEILEKVQHISWNNKYKLTLLQGLFTSEPNLIKHIDHTELIRCILKSQENPFLASAAGKLYFIIVERISEQDWADIYLPEIRRFIEKEYKMRNVHKTAFKYLLFRTFKMYYEHFTDILVRPYNPKTIPIYSILQLTKVIIENKTNQDIEIPYNFPHLLDIAEYHSDQDVRNLLFFVICHQHYNEIKIFTKIKQFIVLNMNDADHGSRAVINKTLESFLKIVFKIVSVLLNMNEIHIVVRNAIEFFNWSIIYLLCQFKYTSNYQRISSSTLFVVTIFDSLKYIDERRRNIFTEFLHFEQFKDQYAEAFLNMLCYTSMTDLNKIITFVINNIPIENLVKLEEKVFNFGYENICSTNVETTQKGMKVIQAGLSILLANNDLEEHANQIYNIHSCFLHQWSILKSSEEENVLSEGYSLYPAISLIDLNLNHFSETDRDSIKVVTKEIVENILEVFQLRAQLPFKGSYCTGLAKACKNEDSKFHAATVNCMWSIIRESCLLVTHFACLLQTKEIIIYSLDILQMVIEKCYHKGALETAGITLSGIIKTVTASDENISVVDSFVNSILNKIPLATPANSTVRRAAETRLILYNIAVSDKRPQKPLYHTIIQFLLDILKLENKEKYSSTPRVLALHCLQPIISDTQCENHVVEYIETIFKILIHCFRDESWCVRNAALQAFGAISSRILGTSLSNTTKTQQYSTSVEEIFFNYPEIFTTIVNHIKWLIQDPDSVKKDGEYPSFVPLCTFLSMSHTRGNELQISKFANDLSLLRETLVDYMKYKNDTQQTILAVKAFTAITYYKEITLCIFKLIENDEELKTKNFFAWAYLIKCLSDKLIQEQAHLPDSIYVNLYEFAYYMLDSALLSLKSYSRSKRVLGFFILYRTGITKLTLNDLTNNFEFLCVKENLPDFLPGTWVENVLIDILRYEPMHTLTDFVTKCVLENIPVDLKITVFKTIRNRIINNDDDNKIFSDNLVLPLFTFLKNEQFVNIRHIMDECVNLIIALKIRRYENDTFLKKFLDLLSTYNVYPDYFNAAFIAIIESQNTSNFDTQIQNYFSFCVQKCYENIKSEEPDDILLKSIIFISKYAIRLHLKPLILKCADFAYLMLQTYNTQLHEIGQKVVVVLFKIKPKYPFANLVHIINHIADLIDPVDALTFLTEKLNDEDISFDPLLNAFEQEPVPRVHNDIVKKQLSSVINKLKLICDVPNDAISEKVEDVNMEQGEGQ